jgi:nitrogen regulatory protein P-II 2
MALKQRKLITIVIEAALEGRLTKDLLKLGAKGYTITHAHGLGPRNQRNGDLEGGNIRLEAVVHADLVEPILELLEANYFPHYACSCWVNSVDVVRDERY